MAVTLPETVVWDNHTCLPLRPGDEAFLPQLARLRASGVDVVGVNVGFGVQTPEQHLRMLAHLRRWLRERPGAYALVGSASDVEDAKRAGKLGVFFDIEGMGALDDQLSLVALYYDLGVRWMSIAYNKNNRAGGGCMDDDPGLSPFGREVIAEMNRVGMLVCCSHTGERSALEAIELSHDPVIFSHSNARALWDHPRNVTDRAILACAHKGGVVGINGIGVFLDEGPADPRAMARHVDYVARLAGIDHVAIGLDYVFDTAELAEYFKSNPLLFGRDAERPVSFSCVAPEQLPGVAAALRALGYGDDDLAKVFGLNLVRVARSVWK